jgi:hypothetical protein
MLTLNFLKQVLSGKKKLMKHNQLKECNYLPRFYEIDTRQIWNEVKNHSEIQPFFPDSFINLKRVPYRPFLFTVYLLDTCNCVS